jgi:hypothetical protein
MLRKDPDPKATKEREARQERERAERQRIESEENNGEVVEFLGSRLRELPMGYVHLPSNKWISVKDQGFRESVYAPDSPGSIRVLAGTDSGAPYRVWEIDESGGLKEIRELPNEFAFGNDFECVPQLIPRSNQCFFVRSANWPHWLREQGMKISFLQDFLRPQRREMVIMDYIKERELAVIRVGTRDVSRAQISPKGNYLIVEHRDDQDHKVMVFSLPVADWSPWWSRCAGLLTFIIIWFAFRKLARR